jgi:hypothetical protein
MGNCLHKDSAVPDDERRDSTLGLPRIIFFGMWCCGVVVVL